MGTVCDHGQRVAGLAVRLANVVRVLRSPVGERGVGLVFLCRCDLEYAVQSLSCGYRMGCGMV